MGLALCTFLPRVDDNSLPLRKSNKQTSSYTFAVKVLRKNFFLTRHSDDCSTGITNFQTRSAPFLVRETCPALWYYPQNLLKTIIFYSLSRRIPCELSNYPSAITIFFSEVLKVACRYQPRSCSWRWYRWCIPVRHTDRSFVVSESHKNFLNLPQHLAYTGQLKRY